MADTEFNWIDEEFPIREYVCVNADRPCQYKQCPHGTVRAMGGGDAYSYRATITPKKNNSLSCGDPKLPGSGGCNKLRGS